LVSTKFYKHLEVNFSIMVSKSIADMKRVWKVTKKPSKKEFFLTFKVVVIGFTIIGMIGFVIELLWQFVLKGIFSS
jgi:protein transport protein SEC61 subunit gamma-like protein